MSQTEARMNTKHMHEVSYVPNHKTYKQCYGLLVS
jgi:hypothetical protein